MNTYTKEELQEILRKHKLWLNDDANGERADLSYSDLSGSDLRGSNLRGSNLRGSNLRGSNLRGSDLSYSDLSYSDLRGSNLRGSNLRGSNLSGSDLSYSDLRGSNLRGSNLRGSNLRGSNLSGSDLRGSDLSGAGGIYFPMSCPDTGAFIGWKRVRNDLIVKLEIPEDARRSSSTGRKCRCDKAKVIAIENVDGTKADCNVAVSKHDADFMYVVGETVEEPAFLPNRWEECAPGIHFFINRQEAVNYE